LNQGPRNPKPTSIGPMSKNSANVPHFIAPRQEFDIPQRVTNASSRQSLDLAKEWASAKRPGSMDAFSLKSRGCGC
jgi:hypothetical protein